MAAVTVLVTRLWQPAIYSSVQPPDDAFRRNLLVMSRFGTPRHRLAIRHLRLAKTAI